jgi:hypothetical protein
MENLQEKIAKALAESRDARKEANNYLILQGQTIDLSDWVTPKEYVKRFGLKSTNVVSNWIRRGIIPPENIVELKMLNGIRLLKAISYN